MRPLLLDLFCGAGGAARGYSDAGFEVLGVDLDDQPHYPFAFLKADALAFLQGFNPADFAAIHASPPCQRYSVASAAWPEKRERHPDLVPSVREALAATRLPYVIENVPGAPLVEPIVLCGAMFGLSIYRHRLFESSLRLRAPVHPPHIAPVAKMGRRPDLVNQFMTVVGHCHPAEAAIAMGINWMSRYEIVQAIPPAYSYCVGRQLMAHLASVAA
ncbi:MAG TPA: DNA cytosine methyltransferase [Candidatus Dormibacteraeota bacterium]|nr:DNA cytosine methyltransferase [Candidatus Dormibacteraeota bacterium]